MDQAQPHPTLDVPAAGAQPGTGTGSGREATIAACLCGDTFVSADAAIEHVLRDHTSARIRRDDAKLEQLVALMLVPSPKEGASY